MLKIEDARDIILNTVKVLPEEEIALTEALGRVLAEDIYSDIDIPGLDNSAMDGYALRSEDIRGASDKNPKALDVIEDLRAGYLARNSIKKNQAIRIMTGAPIPDGADSVIMVEDTKKQDNRVEVLKEIEPGKNIRKQAEDIRRGEKVISKGDELNCGRIGLLASLGRPKIKARKRPKIAILATGDEVVDINDEISPGKLRNSNTYSLYSLVIKNNGMPRDLGIAKDDPDELKAKIRQGLDCDIILTSGGVSVGDYDLVKTVLSEMGTGIEFWKVAMKPGKPLAFGTIEGVPVFGLPGNPVSSMISFEVFVRPSILKMSGGRSDDIKEVDAVLDEDIKKRAGIRCFMRARTRWDGGRYVTHTTGPQGSGILKSMGLADSLIILPEEKESFKRGESVRVRFL